MGVTAARGRRRLSSPNDVWFEAEAHLHVAVCAVFEADGHRQARRELPVHLPRLPSDCESDTGQIPPSRRHAAIPVRHRLRRERAVHVRRTSSLDLC